MTRRMLFVVKFKLDCLLQLKKSTFSRINGALFIEVLLFSLPYFSLIRSWSLKIVKKKIIPSKLKIYPTCQSCHAQTSWHMYLQTIIIVYLATKGTNSWIFFWYGFLLFISGLLFDKQYIKNDNIFCYFMK